MPSIVTASQPQESPLQLVGVEGKRASLAASLGLRRAVGKSQLVTGTAMSSDGHEPEERPETWALVACCRVAVEGGRGALYQGEALRASASMLGPWCCFKE